MKQPAQQRITRVEIHFIRLRFIESHDAHEKPCPSAAFLHFTFVKQFFNQPLHLLSRYGTGTIR